MRSVSKTVLLQVSLLVGVLGCGGGGGGGGGGRTGLGDCGRFNQACCTTGTACAGTLVCQGGTCGDAQPPVTPPIEPPTSICAEGGTVEAVGAALTIPAGALTACTDIELVRSAETVAGYELYSPEFEIRPLDQELAVPATLTVNYAVASGDEPERATMFWSRKGTTGFEQVDGEGNGTVQTVKISRFGKGFVADGVDYVDPPDPSCVVSKLVEGRPPEVAAMAAMDPATVALFFTVDDCWGRPIPGLAGDDFSVLEDGSLTQAIESKPTILSQHRAEIFVSLVIDMSASVSTQPTLLASVVESAQAFVTDLQVTRGLPVHIGIKLFAGAVTGSSVFRELQAPTRNTDALRLALEDLGEHPEAYELEDPNSTNLNGAVVEALQDAEAAEEEFRGRNFGGAFTVGYVVLFTDGRHNSGGVTHAEVIKAVADSPEQVVAVGLQGPEYDPVALKEIAVNGVITARSVGQLSVSFAALANRMAGQLERFYLLGYCSPKRPNTQSGGSNDHVVVVRVEGAKNETMASHEFSAAGFGLGGCKAENFATICDDKECGGLGCGACDDRVSTCNPATYTCDPL